MNLIECQGSSSAGKTIRQFEQQVARKRDWLDALVFADFDNPTGRVDVTDVTLAIDSLSVGAPGRLLR